MQGTIPGACAGEEDHVQPGRIASRLYVLCYEQINEKSNLGIGHIDGMFLMPTPHSSCMLHCTTQLSEKILFTLQGVYIVIWFFTGASNPPLSLGELRTSDTVKHTSLFTQLSDDPSATI